MVASRFFNIGPPKSSMSESPMSSVYATYDLASGLYHDVEGKAEVTLQVNGRGIIVWRTTLCELYMMLREPMMIA